MNSAPLIQANDRALRALHGARTVNGTWALLRVGAHHRIDEVHAISSHH
jgi:hypothetical protein